jgi:alpha 1,3-mannosyltransferase
MKRGMLGCGTSCGTTSRAQHCRNQSRCKRGMEEGRLGRGVVDKGRLGVLMGLLHACWQNSKEIRKEETYMHTHGDKETYWLGMMELSGVPYSFAEYYGAALGKAINDTVHGSTIAHVDEAKKLLWFNGSLLKKKGFGGDPREYFAPDSFMLGGNWTWTLEGEFTACMDNAERVDILPAEKAVIERTVEAAEKLDQSFAELFGLPEKVEAKAGNSTVPSTTVKGESVSLASQVPEVT